MLQKNTNFSNLELYFNYPRPSSVFSLPDAEPLAVKPSDYCNVYCYINNIESVYQDGNNYDTGFIHIGKNKMYNYDDETGIGTWDLKYLPFFQSTAQTGYSRLAKLFPGKLIDDCWGQVDPYNNTTAGDYLVNKFLVNRVFSNKLMPIYTTDAGEESKYIWYTTNDTDDSTTNDTDDSTTDHNIGITTDTYFEVSKYTTSQSFKVPKIDTDPSDTDPWKDYLNNLWSPPAILMSKDYEMLSIPRAETQNPDDLHDNFVKYENVPFYWLSNFRHLFSGDNNKFNEFYNDMIRSVFWGNNSVLNYLGHPENNVNYVAKPYTSKLIFRIDNAGETTIQQFKNPSFPLSNNDQEPTTSQTLLYLRTLVYLQAQLNINVPSESVFDALQYIGKDFSVFDPRDNFRIGTIDDSLVFNSGSYGNDAMIDPTTIDAAIGSTAYYRTTRHIIQTMYTTLKNHDYFYPIPLISSYADIDDDFGLDAARQQAIVNSIHEYVKDITFIGTEEVGQDQREILIPPSVNVRKTDTITAFTINEDGSIRYYLSGVTIVNVEHRSTDNGKTRIRLESLTPEQIPSDSNYTVSRQSLTDKILTTNHDIVEANMDLRLLMNNLDRDAKDTFLSFPNLIGNVMPNDVSDDDTRGDLSHDKTTDINNTYWSGDNTQTTKDYHPRVGNTVWAMFFNAGIMKKFDHLIAPDDTHVLRTWFMYEDGPEDDEKPTSPFDIFNIKIGENTSKKSTDAIRMMRPNGFLPGIQGTRAHIDALIRWNKDDHDGMSDHINNYIADNLTRVSVNSWDALNSIRNGAQGPVFTPNMFPWKEVSFDPKPTGALVLPYNHAQDSYSLNNNAYISVGSTSPYGDANNGKGFPPIGNRYYNPLKYNITNYFDSQTYNMHRKVVTEDTTTTVTKGPKSYNLLFENGAYGKRLPDNQIAFTAMAPNPNFAEFWPEEDATNNWLTSQPQAYNFYTATDNDPVQISLNRWSEFRMMMYKVMGNMYGKAWMDFGSVTNNITSDNYDKSSGNELYQNLFEIRKSIQLRYMHMLGLYGTFGKTYYNGLTVKPNKLTDRYSSPSNLHTNLYGYDKDVNAMLNNIPKPVRVIMDLQNTSDIRPDLQVKMDSFLSNIATYGTNPIRTNMQKILSSSDSNILQTNDGFWANDDSFSNTVFSTPMNYLPGGWGWPTYFSKKGGRFFLNNIPGTVAFPLNENCRQTLPDGCLIPDENDPLSSWITNMTPNYHPSDGSDIDIVTYPNLNTYYTGKLLKTNNGTFGSLQPRPRTDDTITYTQYAADIFNGTYNIETKNEGSMVIFNTDQQTRLNAVNNKKKFTLGSINVPYRTFWQIQSPKWRMRPSNYFPHNDYLTTSDNLSAHSVDWDDRNRIYHLISKRVDRHEDWNFNNFSDDYDPILGTDIHNDKTFLPSYGPPIGGGHEEEFLFTSDDTSHVPRMYSKQFIKRRCTDLSPDILSKETQRVTNNYSTELSYLQKRVDTPQTLPVPILNLNKTNDITFTGVNNILTPKSDSKLLPCQFKYAPIITSRSQDPYMWSTNDQSPIQIDMGLTEIGYKTIDDFTHDKFDYSFSGDKIPYNYNVTPWSSKTPNKMSEPPSSNYSVVLSVKREDPKLSRKIFGYYDATNNNDVTNDYYDKLIYSGENEMKREMKYTKIFKSDTIYLNSSSAHIDTDTDMYVTIRSNLGKMPAYNYIYNSAVVTAGESYARMATSYSYTAEPTVPSYDDNMYNMFNFYIKFYKTKTGDADTVKDFFNHTYNDYNYSSTPQPNKNLVATPRTDASSSAVIKNAYSNFSNLTGRSFILYTPTDDTTTVTAYIKPDMTFRTNPVAIRDSYHNSVIHDDEVYGLASFVSQNMYTDNTEMNMDFVPTNSEFVKDVLGDVKQFGPGTNKNGRWNIGNFEHNQPETLGTLNYYNRFYEKKNDLYTLHNITLDDSGKLYRKYEEQLSLGRTTQTLSSVLASKGVTDTDNIFMTDLNNDKYETSGGYTFSVEDAIIPVKYVVDLRSNKVPTRFDRNFRESINFDSDISDQDKIIFYQSGSSNKLFTKIYIYHALTRSLSFVPIATNDLLKIIKDEQEKLYHIGHDGTDYFLYHDEEPTYKVIAVTNKLDEGKYYEFDNIDAITPGPDGIISGLWKFLEIKEEFNFQSLLFYKYTNPFYEKFSLDYDNNPINSEIVVSKGVVFEVGDTISMGTNYYEGTTVTSINPEHNDDTKQRITLSSGGKGATITAGTDYTLIKNSKGTMVKSNFLLDDDGNPKMRTDVADAWSNVNDLTPYRQPTPLYDNVLPAYGCLPMSGGKMVWNEILYNKTGHRTGYPSNEQDSNLTPYVTCVKNHFDHLKNLDEMVTEYKCTQYKISSVWNNNVSQHMNTYFPPIEGFTVGAIKNVTILGKFPELTSHSGMYISKDFFDRSISSSFTGIGASLERSINPFPANETDYFYRSSRITSTGNITKIELDFFNSNIGDTEYDVDGGETVSGKDLSNDLSNADSVNSGITFITKTPSNIREILGYPGSSGNPISKMSYGKLQNITTPNNFINGKYVSPISSDVIFAKIGGERFFYTTTVDVIATGNEIRYHRINTDQIFKKWNTSNNSFIFSDFNDSKSICPSFVDGGITVSITNHVLDLRDIFALPKRTEYTITHVNTYARNAAQIALNDIRNFVKRINPGDIIRIEQKYEDTTYNLVVSDKSGDYSLKIEKQHADPVSGNSYIFPKGNDMTIKTQFTYVSVLSTKFSKDGDSKNSITMMDLSYTEGTVLYKLDDNNRYSDIDDFEVANRSVVTDFKIVDTIPLFDVKTIHNSRFNIVFVVTDEDICKMIDLFGTIISKDGKSTPSDIYELNKYYRKYQIVLSPGEENIFFKAIKEVGEDNPPFDDTGEEIIYDNTHWKMIQLDSNNITENKEWQPYHLYKKNDIVYRDRMLMPYINYDSGVALSEKGKLVSFLNSSYPHKLYDDDYQNVQYYQVQNVSGLISNDPMFQKRYESEDIVRNVLGTKNIREYGSICLEQNLVPLDQDQWDKSDYKGCDQPLAIYDNTDGIISYSQENMIKNNFIPQITLGGPQNLTQTEVSGFFYSTHAAFGPGNNDTTDYQISTDGGYDDLFYITEKGQGQANEVYIDSDTEGFAHDIDSTVSRRFRKCMIDSENFYLIFHPFTDSNETKIYYVYSGLNGFNISRLKPNQTINEKRAIACCKPLKEEWKNFEINPNAVSSDNFFVRTSDKMYSEYKSNSNSLSYITQTSDINKTTETPDGIKLFSSDKLSSTTTPMTEYITLITGTYYAEKLIGGILMYIPDLKLYRTGNYTLATRVDGYNLDFYTIPNARPTTLKPSDTTLGLDSVFYNKIKYNDQGPYYLYTSESREGVNFSATRTCMNFSLYPTSSTKGNFADVLGQFVSAKYIIGPTKHLLLSLPNVPCNYDNKTSEYPIEYLGDCYADTLSEVISQAVSYIPMEMSGREVDVGLMGKPTCTGKFLEKDKFELSNSLLLYFVPVEDKYQSSDENKLICRIMTFFGTEFMGWLKYNRSIEINPDIEINPYSTNSYDASVTPLFVSYTNFNILHTKKQTKVMIGDKAIYMDLYDNIDEDNAYYTSNFRDEEIFEVTKKNEKYDIKKLDDDDIYFVVDKVVDRTNPITGNITLSAPVNAAFPLAETSFEYSPDPEDPEGKTYLFNDETNSKNNGVYTYRDGKMHRHPDFDTIDKIKINSVVYDGTSKYKLTVDDSNNITVNSYHAIKPSEVDYYDQIPDSFTVPSIVNNPVDISNNGYYGAGGTKITTSVPSVFKVTSGDLRNTYWSYDTTDNSKVFFTEVTQLYTKITAMTNRTNRLNTEKLIGKVRFRKEYTSANGFPLDNLTLTPMYKQKDIVNDNNRITQLSNIRQTRLGKNIATENDCSLFFNYNPFLDDPIRYVYVLNKDRESYKLRSIVSMNNSITIHSESNEEVHRNLSYNYRYRIDQREQDLTKGLKLVIKNDDDNDATFRINSNIEIGQKQITIPADLGISVGDIIEMDGYPVNTTVIKINDDDDNVIYLSNLNTKSIEEGTVCTVKTKPNVSVIVKYYSQNQIGVGENNEEVISFISDKQTSGYSSIFSKYEEELSSQNETFIVFEPIKNTTKPSTIKIEVKYDTILVDTFTVS